MTFLISAILLLSVACTSSSTPPPESPSQPIIKGEPNRQPIITSLTIDDIPAKETEQIRVLNTRTIACIAEDPDGDQLNFIWSTTGGKIQQQGARVGWTAPGVAGDYKVTVIVTDGKDGKAQAFVNFKVACCHD